MCASLEENNEINEDKIKYKLMLITDTAITHNISTADSQLLHPVRKDPVISGSISVYSPIIVVNFNHTQDDV